jgi:hypothetical protein
VLIALLIYVCVTSRFEPLSSGWPDLRERKQISILKSMFGRDWGSNHRWSCIMKNNNTHLLYFTWVSGNSLFYKGKKEGILKNSNFYIGLTGDNCFSSIPYTIIDLSKCKRNCYPILKSMFGRDWGSNHRWSCIMKNNNTHLLYFTWVSGNSLFHISPKFKINNLISPLYSWKITHLTLSNNHSLTLHITLTTKSLMTSMRFIP